MSEVQLYHRLYTHMPESPGELGGRPYQLGEIDAEAVLTAAQLRRLDVLLGSIVPPAKGRAWVVCRFAGQPYDYGCLVVSDSALDAHGRTGVLTHARLAQVDPAKAMLELPALADVALTASRGGELAGLARRLRDEEPSLSVASWSSVNVEGYAREDLSAILGALLAGIPRPDTTIHARLPHEVDRVRMLVNAWPLLPLVFQRALSCSVDAQEGAKVQVAFSGAPATIPSEIHKLARRYLGWVFDRPDDARQLIENLNSPALTEFERELKAAQNAFTGESPMTKPKPKNRDGELRSEQRSSVDPQLVELLNEQIAASEASIYDWLENALRSHNITADAPPSAFKRGGGAGSGLLSNAVMAAATIALLALAGAGWMWMRTSRAERRISALERKVVELSHVTGVAPPAATSTDTSETTEQDLLATPESIAGQNWPERFQWVVENRQREIVPLIVRTAKAAPADRFSAARQRELQRLVDVLQSNELLIAADRRLLRAYLFELAAAERVTDNRAFAIDGAPADVPASLVRMVKEELRIGAATADPADADLQSEAVLRWIAQHR